MNNKPIVSIIVPVYNTELYIKQCLDSIVNQTFHDFELILVDDGSTDKSGLICDEYSQIDNRIRVFHKKNGGLPSARNYGLAMVRGDFVTFVDSDDYVSPNYIEAMINNSIINKSDAVMAKEYGVFYDKDGRITRKISFTNEIVNEYVDEKSFLVFCKSKGFADMSTKLFRVSLFDKMSFDEKLGWGEDFMFMYNMSCVHPHLQTTEMNAVYYYRKFDFQSSITKWQNKSIYYLIKKMYSIYRMYRIKKIKGIDFSEFVNFYNHAFISRLNFCVIKVKLYELIKLLPNRILYYKTHKSFKILLQMALPIVYHLLVTLRKNK